MAVNSPSDLVLHATMSENLIRMQSNCRMQASILRAMHVGDGSLCDVTLYGVPPENMELTSLQPIRAHKVVLAYASKHLYELLTSDDYTDSHQSEYRIENVDHETLRRIVDFMYTDQLTAAPEHAVDVICRVLTGAKYLVMKNLADACETFLTERVRLKPENCVVMWCFARKHTCLELMHATSIYIAKNLSDVLKDAEFLLMLYDDCAKLLLNEAMIAADADQRCLAAIAWLSYDSIGRVPYMHDIFNMVPLTPGLVSDDVLREINKCDMVWEHAPNVIRKLTTAVLDAKKPPPPPTVSKTSLPVATPTPAAVVSPTNHGRSKRNWYVVAGDRTPRLFMHYDVDRKMWSHMSVLPWERENVSVCAIANRLVTMGGEKDGFDTDDIDEYDLLTSTWNTSCAKLRRSTRLATVCSMQQVYALSSLHVEKYNWQTKRVVKLDTSKQISALYCTAVSTKNNIFVAGGWGAQGSIDKFDMCTNAITKVGRMSKNLEGPAGALSGDDFYLIGGSYANKCLPPVNSVEIFNICTGQVSAAPSLLQGRIRSKATTLYDGNVICLVGGSSGALNGHLATVQCLDKREGKWTVGSVVPNMPRAAANFGFAAF